MSSLPEKWFFIDDPQEAILAQKEMASKVILEDHLISSPHVIGGVDVSNTPLDPEQMIFGALVLTSFPSLRVIETKTQADHQPFPYVPGLLGFREVPTLIRAYQKLKIKPDLMMVDGHGISHPRGLGIASHLGVLLEIPTIGVAKSILVGKPACSLSEEPGSQAPLMFKNKVIGMMVRTKKRCSPLIVSAGHKITLESAVGFVLQCLRGYRLPEPTRQAHLAANVCRQSYMQKLV